MKQEEQETALSVIQRLKAKKELTEELYSKRFVNKTAQDRRLNNFYDKENKGRIQSSIEEGTKSGKK